MVDWVPSRPERAEGLIAVYDGGVLAPGEVAAITTQDGELAGYAFVEPDEVAERVSPLLARRIAACINAVRAGTVRSPARSPSTRQTSTGDEQTRECHCPLAKVDAIQRRGTMSMVTIAEALAAVGARSPWPSWAGCPMMAAGRDARRGPSADDDSAGRRGTAVRRPERCQPRRPVRRARAGRRAPPADRVRSRTRGGPHGSGRRRKTH